MTEGVHDAAFVLVHGSPGIRLTVSLTCTGLYHQSTSHQPATVSQSTRPTTYARHTRLCPAGPPAWRCRPCQERQSDERNNRSRHEPALRPRNHGAPRPRLAKAISAAKTTVRYRVQEGRRGTTRPNPSSARRDQPATHRVRLRPRRVACAQQLVGPCAVCLCKRCHCRRRRRVRFAGWCCEQHPSRGRRGAYHD